MLVVQRLVGQISPESALRRSIQLTEKGRVSEAFTLLTIAAKVGIPDAEYRIGRCYLEGSGVPLSRSEAVRWLQRASIHGSIEAQVLLSALCIRGLANLSRINSAGGENGATRLFASDAPCDPDFKSARKWACQAAISGSSEGEALLAYVLTYGPKSMRDLEKAHRLYEQSAAAGCPQGHLGYAISLARRSAHVSEFGQVVAHLCSAAEAELPTAIYLLAVLMEKGAGVKRSPVRAFQLYCRAAESGHRSAQVRWGAALLEGRDVEQDITTGESWLRRAALDGDPQAATLLGDFYVRDAKIPNYREAASCYRRAANLGYPAAARALASLYATGAGVEQDKGEAARWLRVAAEAGDSSSQVDLANLVLQGAAGQDDPAKIADWFQKAAESGDLIAAFNLGLCLVNGIGVERDEQRAASWLRRAAKSVTEAQYLYGRMLLEGRGVPCELKTARGWFARAAQAGHVDAQVALAEMMLSGRGGLPSPASAVDLFNKAAAKGHAGAMFALGALHTGGHGIPVDHHIAQKWFRAAAELGHGHAQMMLGRYLSSGVAGAREPAEARVWLERAVAQGVVDAEPDLAALN